MPQLLLSDVTATLKEVLLPYVRDNFPKETILLDQLKRNARTSVMNDEFIAPIYTTRHGGVANLADDGNNVISSGGRDTSRATVPVEIVTGALNISKLTIDASKSNALAVQNNLMAQTETLASDFARQVNRQLYSDGVGVVSQVRTTGGSVSSTVAAVEAIDGNNDDGRVQDKYGTINGDIAPTKYLAPDQIVGIGTAGAADGTISAVSGTSITLTGATAIAASDAIYIQDGSGEGAGTSEILGIGAALSSSTGTSTYAGLARNTTGWTPNFGSVSEALTHKRIADTYTGAREYSGRGDMFLILVNKTLYNKYGEILTSLRRTVNETDLVGGWTGLEFAAGAGKVGVFLDYDVPDGEVIVLNLESWTITQVSDIDWMENPGGDGGGLLRLASTIQYQAVMHWFVNALCLSPAANGKETRKTG